MDISTLPLPFRVVRRLLDPLRAYHQFDVVGLEHVPRSGPVLMVVHHSFATYDGFMLGQAVVEHTGRVPRALGDDQLFALPGVAGFLHQLGVRPASPSRALDMLRRGEMVMVAPGGMREALRPTATARYRSNWVGRRGFVRLAIDAQVPVILAACPAADRIYRVYDHHVTRAIYEQLHLPLALVRGVGPTLIPRPVQLTAYVDTPVSPPNVSAEDDEAVDAFHDVLTARMGALLRRRGRAAGSLAAQA
jgi:1-acyl-sn-glycerol-3-phosphate acyltransferase